MNNTQKPLPNQKDPNQQRLEVLERTVDNLRHHLVSTLELTYALAAELAEAKGIEKSRDAICTQALAELNTLNTLKTTQRDFKRR